MSAQSQTLLGLDLELVILEYAARIFIYLAKTCMGFEILNCTVLHTRCSLLCRGIVQRLLDEMSSQNGFLFWSSIQSLVLVWLLQRLASLGYPMLVSLAAT